MAKPARQAMIRELLDRETVWSQAELRRLLARRGIHADQATLSRDLKELGVVKHAGGYALSNGAQPAPDLDLSAVWSAEVTGSLVVLKTPPGYASGTALTIDRATVPGVIGTIAGDDTIFVATSGAKAARAFAELAREGFAS